VVGICGDGDIWQVGINCDRKKSRKDSGPTPIVIHMWPSPSLILIIETKGQSDSSYPLKKIGEFSAQSSRGKLLLLTWTPRSWFEIAFGSQPKPRVKKSNKIKSNFFF
jgi:hypothetical protein